ncbi:hypothetical protein TNIN_442291 [Trichonephila inaurata madagascariensis]|uniref:Uncharacterized protein n=1 Tax=Trichonephila inaurata madagascariensis TaxID=2747483 RepID=A0A8X6IVM2_9ARAC|nr:hypothetical protein TNIN_442291 [Trichonephila inaurata madagascariensis]
MLSDRKLNNPKILQYPQFCKAFQYPSFSVDTRARSLCSSSPFSNPLNRFLEIHFFLFLSGREWVRDMFGQLLPESRITGYLTCVYDGEDLPTSLHELIKEWMMHSLLVGGFHHVAL